MVREENLPEIPAPVEPVEPASEDRLILSTRHHHTAQARACDLCRMTIPAGARAVRVAYSGNKMDAPAGTRRNVWTERYHNRCWVEAENEIKAACQGPAGESRMVFGP